MVVNSSNPSENKVKGQIPKMKGLITSNWQYFFLQQQLTVKATE